MPFYRSMYSVREWRDLMRQFQARRNELGLRREDAEQRLGCTEGIMKHWEASLWVPGANYLILWAKLLGCRIVLVPDESASIQGAGGSSHPVKAQEPVDNDRRNKVPVKGGSQSVCSASPA